MTDQPPEFDVIWSRWVVPLRGHTITGLNGLSNQVVSVDRTGVVRISRNELPSRIPIVPFRWAVEVILSRGSVTRKAINEAFPHRYSSGVQLIFEQIPLFEASGRPATIRLRDDWKSQFSRS